MFYFLINGCPYLSLCGVVVSQTHLKTRLFKYDREYYLNLIVKKCH